MKHYSRCTVAQNATWQDPHFRHSTASMVLRVNLEGGDTVVFDDAYVIESMLTPNAKIATGHKPQMPPYKDRITDDEMKQIIMHIRSLK